MVLLYNEAEIGQCGDIDLLLLVVQLVVGYRVQISKSSNKLNARNFGVGVGGSASARKIEHVSKLVLLPRTGATATMRFAQPAAARNRSKRVAFSLRNSCVLRTARQAPGHASRSPVLKGVRLVDQIFAPYPHTITDLPRCEQKALASRQAQPIDVSRCVPIDADE